MVRIYYSCSINMQYMSFVVENFQGVSVKCAPVRFEFEQGLSAIVIYSEMWGG